MREIDKVYQCVDATEPLDLEDLSEKLEVIAQAWDNMDWDLVFIYQLLEENDWEMSERQKQLFALVESYVDPQYLHPKEFATV